MTDATRAAAPSLRTVNEDLLSSSTAFTADESAITLAAYSALLGDTAFSVPDLASHEGLSFTAVERALDARPGIARFSADGTSKVGSHCPVTGEAVALVVGPDGVLEINPPSGDDVVRRLTRTRRQRSRRVLSLHPSPRVACRRQTMAAKLLASSASRPRHGA